MTVAIPLFMLVMSIGLAKYLYIIRREQLLQCEAITMIGEVVASLLNGQSELAKGQTTQIAVLKQMLETETQGAKNTSGMIEILNTLVRKLS